MNGETNGRVKSPLATNNDGQVAKTLQRGLDALYEGNNDETTEGISYMINCYLCLFRNSQT
jgi:hypothetical protein